MTSLQSYDAPLARRMLRVAEAQGRAESSALCLAVVHRFELSSYVPGLFELLRYAVKANMAQDWLANFTKTLFLTGNPQRTWLQDQFHASGPDCGWMLVYGDRDLNRVSAKLPPLLLGEALPAQDSCVALSASSLRDVEVLAHAGQFSFQSYLVAITHLLAEAFIAGELDGVGKVYFRWSVEPILIASADLGVRIAQVAEVGVADAVLRYR